MTEAEWLECDDPQSMVEFLRGKDVGRPLSLLAVAWCRTQRFGDPRSRLAVKWSERLIEGLVSLDDEDGPTDSDCYLMAAEANRCMAIAARATEGRTDEAIDMAQELFELLADTEERTAIRRLRKVASWARCVFGNPFERLRFDQAWVAWEGGICPKLAEAVYADRAFDRMLVLADALEDAGCTEAALLDHLRGPGPHIRGCWALDLILSRCR